MRFVVGYELDEFKEYWSGNGYDGHGEEFFRFFEAFMKSKGYDDIVFYACHTAALAICRKREYKEGGYLEELREYVFSLSLKKEVMPVGLLGNSFPYQSSGRRSCNYV